MKKLFAILAVAGLLTACGESASTEEKPTTDTAAAATTVDTAAAAVDTAALKVDTAAVKATDTAAKK